MADVVNPCIIHSFHIRLQIGKRITTRYFIYLSLHPPVLHTILIYRAFTRSPEPRLAGWPRVIEILARVCGQRSRRYVFRAGLLRVDEVLLLVALEELGPAYLVHI